MRYRLLIYKGDAIVEKYMFDNIEEAARFGEERVAELGKSHWLKIKAD